jgi:adenylate cyclase
MKLATPLAPTRRADAAWRLPSRRGLLAVLAALLLCAGGLAGWMGYLRHIPATQDAGVERYAYPLPDKPSIAVLPFINVGGQEEQDRLAEGLTDDLITELSKVSGLFVIARHSVFALKDAAVRLPQIAAELGVRYLLEGTLQRADRRLRINVKLIDAVSGLSLWAERYDRHYEDIFAIQDDVIGKIISALSVKLSEGERDQLARIPTDNLEAYDYYLRAEHEGFLYSDVDAYRRALAYYQKAIDLDANFSDAHAGIARIAIEVLRFDYNLIWSAAVARKIAYDAAGRALAINPDNARAHTVLALLQLVDGRQAEAIDSAERAVAVQPSDPEAFGNLALVLALTGSRAEAVKQIDTAIRLNPTPPPPLKLLAGVVLYTARQNDRAMPLLEAASDEMPNVEPAREYLAAAYIHHGDAAAGRRQLARLLGLFPEDNLTYYSYLYDYWRDDDRRYHLSALHQAGMPEWPFGFEGRASDRVEGDALRLMVADRTWGGKHKNGTDFVQYFGRDGSTAYRSANTNLTGVFEVEDDRLCERFEGYFLDRMACGYVYRAEHPVAGAEYVSVTPQALKFFSVEKQQ